MASGDTVDGIIEIEDTSRRQTDGKLGQLDDENDEEEKEKGMTRGKAPSPLDMAGAANQAGGGPKTPPGITRHRSERERKLGHRRVGVGGEITYKKIQTSQIMGSIQLGIQHAVGGLASKPERDLLMQDFMTVETTNFDSEGSNHTPAHHYSDFKFKTYAPIAFRYFRDLFGIQPDDFLISMCSAPLRELSNPGASGSIFYLTADDEFIIKTVQHKEGEFLQKLLPGYYMNLNQNPRTLLPKFFGLYCYQCNSKNVRLVAMNNLLPSVIKLHHKYDLKGSTYKRKASKSERLKNSPTYKDLDFMDHHPEGIFLEADTYTALIKTIQRDCRVLESFKIMDYSLLVGIHNLDQAAREKAEKRTQERHAGDRGEGSSGEGGSGGIASAADMGDDRTSTGGGQAGALNRSRSINRQRLVAHSTAMESIQAESEPIDEEEDVPPGGIPARNAKGERLLMFLGIIDILQSYRLKKKLEHTWKSMIHDGDTVSVHRPGFYAQRFQDFMAKTVFKKIPSLDLPEIKGNHRKFRTLVTSYIALKDMLALKHSPSKRRSISKGGGGRLGSLPGAGLQDADTVAPSSTEEEGGLMQSPHHAVVSASSGSKPGSPTAAQQTIGFATPKVAATATTAGGSGPSALSQPSPPTTASPALPSSSSPPSTTVHYPAVLKGRPVGISMAGSPAGSSSSTPGKPRIPPPVPPRSPKRPHHGQQSVRQGSRGLHRPRAEEERGGPLAGPGALRDTFARTSDFLYPSEHRSSLSTENAPQPLSSPATKAMTDHPDYPPRRIRVHALSESSPVSLHSDSRITSKEGISPVVPPRRSHKGARKSDSRDFKVDLLDKGNGISGQQNFSNFSKKSSDVSMEANKLPELSQECIGIESISYKSGETKHKVKCSEGNSVFEEIPEVFDSSKLCIKEEYSFEENREEIVNIDYDAVDLNILIASSNGRETKVELLSEERVERFTGVESDSELDSKGYHVQHDPDAEVSLALSVDVVNESGSNDKEGDHLEDAIEYSDETSTTESNREDELFSESLQALSVASSDDRSKKLNREKLNGLPSKLKQLHVSPTKKCVTLSSGYAENLQTSGKEINVNTSKNQGLKGQQYRSDKVSEEAERSGKGYDELLDVSVVEKSKESLSNKVIHISPERVVNCGIHRAQMIVLNYIEPDKSAKGNQNKREHSSESSDVDCEEGNVLTQLNHMSSKICDKSAQLKSEDEIFQGISNAHMITPATLTLSGGNRKVDGCGTNVDIFSREQVPITPNLVSMRMDFGSQIINNSDAIKAHQINSFPYPFSHRNALPKPFSRSEIHGFGRGQSFRSVLPPSSPNRTASHVPPVINGYVDLEDVI